jgi:hypothetical protein
MEKTITLNETQMKLLKEYMAATETNERFHQALSDAAAKPADKDNAIAHDLAYRTYIRTRNEVDITARIFASSVAEVV